MLTSASALTQNTEDSNLKIWERYVVAFLVISFPFAIFIKFIASPQYGSMMFEYVLKFVPLFLDGPFSSILDFNGVGDPRGRVVNNFFTWVNIHVRKELLLLITIHPAFSVNWLLYPITLATFYVAVLRISTGYRYAIMATLLYAASPGMLDTLIDYYLPGKALMNFWFSASLFGGAMFAPINRAQRPLLGSFLLASSTFLGLLSDETAIFIPICVCLMFGWQILHGNSAKRNSLLVVCSFLFAFTSYSLVVFLLIPLANVALGQAPLSLFESLVNGPYAALFGDNPRGVGGLLQYYAPIGLLETIVSTHLVPRRVVNVSWTSGTPFPWFFQWSRHEQIALYVALGSIIFLFQSVRLHVKKWVFKVTLCFAIYVLVQAVFICALSGYLIESSYYAALGSALIALLVGAIASAPGRSRDMQILSWILVFYMVWIEFSNMIDTAKRHPYLGEKSLTWIELGNIRKQMAHGEIDLALSDQPFPSRRFFYAFEVASSLASSKGQRVDYLPLATYQNGLVRHLNIDKWADPNISRESVITPQNEELAKISRLPTIPLGTDFFNAGSFRGETKDWGYQWMFDGKGKVTQKAWRFGLMRVWTAKGHIETRESEICLVFNNEQETCFSTIYQQGEWDLAYTKDGMLVTRFRRES